MAQPSAPQNSEGSSRAVRDEVQAYVRTRRDLGPDYDDELVESLVEKIERALDARLAQVRPSRGGHNNRGVPVSLLAICMGLGIPLTAVAGGIAGLPGIITVWAALVFIILYFDLRR